MKVIIPSINNTKDIIFKKRYIFKILKIINGKIKAVKKTDPSIGKWYLGSEILDIFLFKSKKFEIIFPTAKRPINSNIEITGDTTGTKMLLKFTI